MADLKSKLAEALINYVEMPGRQLNAFFGAKPKANPLAAARALKQVGSDILGGVQSAYTAPGRALSGKLDPNSPEGQQEAMNFALNFMGAGSAPALNKPMQHGSLGITAYHGSPYKFDKFDISKIGSGEGNQVYGHGLYFAEHPEVAQSYKNMEPSANVSPRRTLNGVELQPNTPEYHAATLLSRNGMTINQAKKDVARWIDEGLQDPRLAREVEGWKKTLETLNAAGKKSAFGELPHQGSFYTVDIPDEHIASMLDWDKSIGEQHPNVRSAINETKKHLSEDDLMMLGGDANLLYGKDVTPNQFLNTWEVIRGEPNFGEKILNQSGVKGVKYFDNQSRDAMQGTRNFVVFDPTDVKILNRE